MHVAVPPVSKRPQEVELCPFDALLMLVLPLSQGQQVFPVKGIYGHSDYRHLCYMHSDTSIQYGNDSESLIQLLEAV